MKFSGRSVVSLIDVVPGVHSNRQSLRPHEAGSRVLQKGGDGPVEALLGGGRYCSMPERFIPGVYWCFLLRGATRCCGGRYGRSVWCRVGRQRSARSLPRCLGLPRPLQKRAWGMDFFSTFVLGAFWARNPTYRGLANWGYKIVRCARQGKPLGLWIKLWVMPG